MLDATSLAESIIHGDIKALVFDFDGTTYESSAGIEHQLRPLMVKHAARKLDIDQHSARKLLATYRKQYKSSILGLQEHHGVDPEEFYRELYDDLDLSRMVPRPGLDQALKILRDWIPLYVMTNSNRSFTHRALGILGLDGVYRSVFTVEDNNFIRKPELEVYELLFDRLGLNPHEIVMFDDIASSLLVMHRLESKTILVGNGLRPPPHFIDLHTDIEYCGAPDFVDASTHDIVNYLQYVNRALSSAS